jgi:hypothetical protein
MDGSVAGFPLQTLSGAELYDPSAGTFTATGNMITPRGGHMATLLPNGTVLIAGGGIAGKYGSLASPALASAELYDPSTGTFSSLPDMSTARFSAIATVLQNGKILIVGGANGAGRGAYSLRVLHAIAHSQETLVADGNPNIPSERTVQGIDRELRRAGREGCVQFLGESLHGHVVLGTIFKPAHRRESDVRIRKYASTSIRLTPDLNFLEYSWRADSYEASRFRAAIAFT